MTGVFPLRDGAQGSWDGLLGQLRKERAGGEASRDSLEKHLLQFESDEVGHTPLMRVRNLEREVGLRRIYLKLEGGNPTGTQKDRIAFAHTRQALREGLPGIGVATCGNYGVAVGLAAAVARLPCRIFIPAAYHTKRLEEMERLGAEIVRTVGDYEESVETSGEWLQQAGWCDANPGPQSERVQMGAYAQIAREILSELGQCPDSIAAPVSNGTTLAGIARGFEQLREEGHISQVPRMIAGSAYHKNPIVRSFLRKLTHCEDLDSRLIHETAVNEPLVNWHSADGQSALDVLYSTRGLAGNASDQRMRDCARLLKRQEGILALPAATAGLIAMVESSRTSQITSGIHVAIITGKGS